jgi:hypothetical protein
VHSRLRLFADNGNSVPLPEPRFAAGSRSVEYFIYLAGRCYRRCSDTMSYGFTAKTKAAMRAKPLDLTIGRRVFFWFIDKGDTFE